MKRILVIDDEPFVREALERVLSAPAVEVLGVPDAILGLAALQESRFDLVIIDVILPGMDGASAIKRMRIEHPGLRIIAISGGGNFGLQSYRPESISTTAYLAACGVAGADDTLAKPFDTVELRSLVGRFLA